MATSRQKQRARGRPAREDATAASEQTTHPPLRVRLPGFVKDEEIGLGDVIKRATYSIGVRPCGGCGRRTGTLNRWVVFTR